MLTATPMPTPTPLHPHPPAQSTLLLSQLSPTPSPQSVMVIRMSNASPILVALRVRCRQQWTLSHLQQSSEGSNPLTLTGVWALMEALVVVVVVEVISTIPRQQRWWNNGSARGGQTASWTRKECLWPGTPMLHRAAWRAIRDCDLDWEKVRLRAANKYY